MQGVLIIAVSAAAAASAKHKNREEIDLLHKIVETRVTDVVPAREIAIVAITGDNGRLSLVPGDNCAGIARKATLELLGVKSLGIILNLHKDLSLGSGLGPVPLVAAAAVNELFGSPLSKVELVQAGLESKATVSGYHVDNIAPSLMGGFVLVRSYSLLNLIPLPFPSDKDLYFVLVIPDFEAPTKEMRAALSTQISMKKHTACCSVTNEVFLYHKVAVMERHMKKLEQDITRCDSKHSCNKLLEFSKQELENQLNAAGS